MKIIILITLILFGCQIFADPAMLEINELAKKHELEKLKISNMKKPIIYGIGAAGISFGTSYAESKPLLTPPSKGPFEDGSTLYDESLYVIWSAAETENRYPKIIIPISGYLGKMATNTFGELDYSSKFLNYSNDGEGGAQKLIRDLYNDLEAVPDNSYNCLTETTCKLIYGESHQRNFVLVLPGAILLLAKEEFELEEIRIIKAK